MEIVWLIAVVLVAGFLFGAVRGYQGRSRPTRQRSSAPTGAYRVEVVGESQYQDALEEICGGRTRDGANQQVTATVVLEDSNPYDENAVRIDIDGTMVGYLSRHAAKTYRQRLKRSGLSLQPVQCAAVIRGGWDRGHRDKGYFGVWLDLPFLELPRHHLPRFPVVRCFNCRTIFAHQCSAFTGTCLTVR